MNDFENQGQRFVALCMLGVLIFKRNGRPRVWT